VVESMSNPVPMVNSSLSPPFVHHNGKPNHQLFSTLLLLRLASAKRMGHGLLQLPRIFSG